EVEGVLAAAFNGDDVRVLTFDDQVYITSESASAFELASSGDSLGTGARLNQSAPLSTRLEVRLGNSPSFTTSTSSFNVRNSAIVNIRDLTDTGARPFPGGVRIEDSTSTAPVFVGARYDDVDLDGTVNAGDALLCEFDKPIRLSGGATVADNFLLAVNGDNFGAGASLAAFSNESTNRSVVITLGTSPVLTVSGTFDSGATAPGAASNVQMAGAGTISISDTLTSGAQNVTAGTSVDLKAQGTSRFRNGQAASVVIGNADATSANVDASSMFSPGGVSHFSGSVTVGANTFAVDLMFVADTANNRVLVFEDKPTGNNADATVVLGQSTFYENLPNQSSDTNPPTGASRMSGPEDVFFAASSNQLFVCDTGNNRVLVFDGVVDSTTGLVALGNGEAASRVLGQSSLVGKDANQGLSAPTSRTLSGPRGIHVSSGQVAVADTGNNRVLIWGSLPSGNNEAASTVLGQTDFVSASANQGGAAAAATLSGPQDVFLDTGLIIANQTGAVLVADTGNNRVLLYATGSPTTGASADVALGQGALTTSAAATTAAGLDAPTGVGALDGGSGGSSTGRIWVADRDNHRVMVYTFDPSNGAEPATGDTGAQIGQAAATNGTENRGNASVAASADSFAFPSKVDVTESAETNVLVADRENHRVLDFTTPPTADTTADIVHGHGLFTVSTANDHQFHEPTDVAISAGQMFVADQENNRVLIFDTVPSAGSTNADTVVGQGNINQTLANQGSSTVLADGLAGPQGVACDGTNLVVADTDNNRVVIFTTIPSADGATPNIVLGQANATSGLPNSGGLSNATMDSPNAVWIEGTQLFVSDRDNHRVLIFDNFASLATGASATVVIGQNDFSSGAANHGDVARANSLHAPSDVTVIGGALYVADAENNRILGWLSIPTLNGTEADIVLGQPDFFTTSADIGKVGFNEPGGIASDGTFFVIADTGNHRVVLYDLVPRVSNVAAVRIFGQTSFNGSLINRGSSFPSASSFWSPRNVWFTGTDLWICDEGNSRVLRQR
ncbi:MAG: NHL repeat-containing protein, partial [Planctomycetota bacterium]